MKNTNGGTGTTDKTVAEIVAIEGAIARARKAGYVVPADHEVWSRLARMRAALTPAPAPADLTSRCLDTPRGAYTRTAY